MDSSNPPRTSLAPGDRFGPYAIVRELGVGSFGAVYEARREPIGRRVALKLLHLRTLKDASVVERFTREAKLAASIKHPHIVDVEDVGEIDGRPFLAMEFLEGETLGEHLDARGRRTPEQALDLLLPVFSAVAAMHARGIVHRDLKPDNIFLWQSITGQPVPKLLDFGTAKATEGEHRDEMTRTGAQMGTPLYMSPEQWRSSRSASAASDQWALAVILYYALAERQPFEADSLPALVTLVTLDPPAPLRSDRPEISEELQGILFRALEKRPADRHASIKDFAAALLPFASPAARSRWSAEFGADLAVDATRPKRGSRAQQTDTANPASGTFEPASSKVPHPRSDGAPRRLWLAVVVSVLIVGGIAIAAVSRPERAEPPHTAVPSAVSPVLDVAHTAPAATPTPDASTESTLVDASVALTADAALAAPTPAAPTLPGDVPRRARVRRAAPQGPALPMAPIL